MTSQKSTEKREGTETDSNCHQLIGKLRETISLLKDELGTSK